ncbi:Hypothetical protein KVN_LOCUS506 [uncultured virus]|nr:Hypothetical protein KVN_LOCUS506 [uncultured virus]
MEQENITHSEAIFKKLVCLEKIRQNILSNEELEEMKILYQKYDEITDKFKLIEQTDLDEKKQKNILEKKKHHQDKIDEILKLNKGNLSEAKKYIEDQLTFMKESSNSLKKNINSFHETIICLENELESINENYVFFNNCKQLIAQNKFEK